MFGRNRMEDELDYINDIDLNDDEDQNLIEEEINKKLKLAMELIKYVEYPTENVIFLNDLKIDQKNIKKDDETIKKIIE